MSGLLLPPGRGATELEDSDGPTRRFAEVLHDYDPALTLEYIPPGSIVDATVDEILKPFRIVKHTPALGREVVKYISADEIKKPHQILNWLWEGDLAKHKPGEIWDRMEGEKRARRMLDLKRQEEEALERQEKVAFLAGGGRDKRHRVQTSRGHFFNTGA